MFILVIVSTLAYFLRLFRWLALLQQKEYRFDRFRAFLASPDGLLELRRIFLLPRNLTELKRPRFTPKIMAILLTALSLSVLALTLMPYPWLTAALLYLFLPLLVFLAAAPFHLATLALTGYFQLRAARLIKLHHPVIIGITGSYGKTTTKILLAHLLQTKFPTWFSPKSYNTAYSLPRSFVSTYRQEPYVITELGAYKRGEIAQLTSVFPPDLGVLTGITPQHLAIFGSYPNLLQAKSELPAALSPSSPFYVNDADPGVSTIAARFPELARVPASSVPIQKIHLTPAGNLSFEYGKEPIVTPLLGLHYLSNCRLAIQVAADLGLSAREIAAGFSSFRPGPEFIRALPSSTGMTIILDDKTANPKGFQAALDLLAVLPGKRKAVITAGLIDLGPRSFREHRHIAMQADSIVDHFLHTTQTGQTVLQKALGAKYLYSPDIASLRQIFTSHPYDTLLIEGRIKSELQTYLLSL